MVLLITDIDSVDSNLEMSHVAFNLGIADLGLTTVVISEATDATQLITTVVD